MVEGVMIIFLAMGFYLLMALLSYSPYDLGWSSTGESDNVSNLVGSSGAWMSDVLFLRIGKLAYLIPMLLFYKAVALFRERHSLFGYSWEVLGLRAAGLMMMLISAFSGYAHIMALYQHAIEQRYRFFSYGDAMLLARQTPQSPTAPL